MSSKQSYRNIKFKLIRDAKTPFPGFDMMSRQINNVPGLPDKPDPVFEEITDYVITWSVQWQMGSPFGVLSFDCSPHQPLEHIYRNDIVIVDYEADKNKLKMLVTGLVSKGKLSIKNEANEIRSGYSFQAKEPGRYFVDHEIYYNEWMEGSDIQPLLRWVTDILLLGVHPSSDSEKKKTAEDLMADLVHGHPDVMIRTIVLRKLLGQGNAISKEFQGGCLLNDGSRLINWFDLSGVVERINPEKGLQQINPGKPVPGELVDKILNDPCTFAYNAENPSSIKGQVWQKLQEYSAQPLWELFTYCEYNDSSRPKQKLFYRPLPFWCEHYRWLLWDQLSVFEYDVNECVGAEEYNWSDEEDLNFVIIQAQSTFMGGNDITAQHILQKYNYGDLEIEMPLTMGKLIERYGFRKYTPRMNCFPMYSDEKAKKIQESIMNSSLRCWDYNYLNAFYITGSFTVPLPDDQELPRIGWKLKRKGTDFEAYITGVSLSGGIGLPLTVTIQFTRGMSRALHEYMVSTGFRQRLLKKWDHNQKLPDGWESWDL